MANLNRVSVPVAVEHKTKLDLSCDHVTTMGFCRLQPVMYRHMMKTEHLSMNAHSVVRPAPIEVPFFGSLVQNLRAFFVPYRLVFPHWNAFYNDVIGVNYSASSLVGEPPRINPNSLIDLFFFGNHASDLSTEVTVNDPYDYQITNNVVSPPVQRYFKFTTVGRRWLYVLESLGYKIIPTYTKKGDDAFYNALALLCYAKVYLDWYSNSQYLNSADVINVEKLLAYNNPLAPLDLDQDDLFNIFKLVQINVYDTDDYYVNAWDNPVAPNNGQFTGFSFVDPTSTGGAFIQTSVNGSPEMISSTLYPNSIGTTYIHEALKKLSDFQKRHALAGARSIDRVLAQYGIVSDSLKQLRSIYVGSQQIAVETGSVMATASGTNSQGVSSQTGDYSGAGFGQGDKAWDFTADEEGMFVVISTINPVGSMVQGYDRFNTILDKKEFFQPELDSLGVAAIQKGEVYVGDGGMLNQSLDQNGYQGVFGFSGRYGHLKRPKSFLTGDFRLPNFYAGGDSWHLFRLFFNSEFLNSSNNPDVQEISHSLSFTRTSDAWQYNRIFQYTDGDYDPFYCFMHFDIASYAPCKPLFETYEFDSDSQRVSTENGNKVN